MRASERWLAAFEPLPRGRDKVLPLGEAVRRAVRPGMTLHFAFSQTRPSAAMAELVRQFRGTEPGFTLALLFTTGPAVALLTEGLARHLVTTLVCEPYPAPAPSGPAQRALAAGRFSIEHWSVLSYVARLEAAARGLSSLPVRGLAGSTLAEENRERLSDLGPGPVAVRAFAPDLSFVHAPCADRQGNVLLAPPLGEGVYGALAARDGVVVTVERLVDTEVLRRHAHLPGIPASRVRSVSVVPFGAHPAGLATAGIDGVEPYGDDARFYATGRDAGRSDDEWRRWVAHWLAEPESHDDYLARLGSERLLWLKGKARPDSWRPELLAALERISPDAPATRSEMMVVAAARMLERKVSEGGHHAILSGLGAGNLAAWLAHAALAERGDDLSLVAELGLFGYAPRPCDPYLFNFRNLATCTLQTDAATVLGLLIGGARANSIGSLGAAQVDASGRFNSTRLGDGTLLVGSGGSNDVASAATEVMITLPAAPERLVGELPYVTGPGDRVTAVVTDLGIFEKPPGASRLRLSRLVGATGRERVEQHVRELGARSGFRFETAPELTVEPPAEAPELTRLRLFDPERAFLGPLESRGG